MYLICDRIKKSAVETADVTIACYMNYKKTLVSIFEWT